AISSSDAVGITSFKFFSRYTFPLVLKNFFGSKSLNSNNFLISSLVGVSFTISIVVKSIFAASNHFFAFLHVLQFGYIYSFLLNGIVKPPHKSTMIITNLT